MKSQLDIEHVEKALLHLKKGGILVSVMSSGIMFRQNKKTLDFWAKVAEHTSEIIELPPGAFRVSGTGVNTVIVKILI